MLIITDKIINLFLKKQGVGSVQWHRQGSEIEWIRKESEQGMKIRSDCHSWIKPVLLKKIIICMFKIIKIAWISSKAVIKFLPEIYNPS